MARLQFETPSSFSARDEFGHTAGNLTTKTAPVGGAWAGGGDVTDFTMNVPGGGADSTARRQAITDTAPRVDWLTPVMTGQGVQCDLVPQLVGGTGPSTAGADLFGVAARVVDASNFLFLGFRAIHTDISVVVGKYVAGALTEIWKEPLIKAQLSAISSSVRLQVDAAGRWAAWWWKTGSAPTTLLAQGLDAVLATGGALATGKPGLVHYSTTSTIFGNPDVFYNNLYAFVPTADAACFASQSLEYRHDGAFREDAAGGTWAEKTVQGRNLYIPCSGAEGRTPRVIVIGSRHDPDTMPHEFGDLRATLTITERYLGVPGS